MTDVEATNELLANDPYAYQMFWSLIGMLCMGLQNQK